MDYAVTSYDGNSLYGGSGFSAGLTLAYLLFVLIICVVIFISMWKIYVKAGEPGWKCLIPFYNSYILCKLTWGKGWIFFLTFIPIVGFVFSIITYVKLAHVFGKSGAFAVGLIFIPIVFFPILAFDNSQYIGIKG